MSSFHSSRFNSTNITQHLPMNKSIFKLTSKIAVTILVIIGLIELALALWTVLENRYKTLAYNLADVGYIDLWILRYLSMCLFASSIITLVMGLILIWGLCSAHVFIFIASTMILLVAIAEFTISVITFASKFPTRLTLQEQLPKLVITYRQGNDERASRALDQLQIIFRCCGSDGRLSYQNNVPLSCNMYSVGCLTRTMFFLDSSLDALAAFLLLFSIIKLLIVIFFYSFLCLFYHYQQKDSDVQSNSANDSSRWPHSSSFNSSSESLPKKMLISSPLTNPDHQRHSIENDYTEKRRIIHNEYDLQSSNKRVQSPAVLLSGPVPSTIISNLSPDSGEEQASRKLSSISEKTERTGTDESEPDLLRVKHYHSKRKAIITSANAKQPPPLPKKLPTIKNRRKTTGDEENDNDSGVERSSSEKSFEDQNSNKRTSATLSSSDSNLKKSSSTKSTPTLSFSNVFVTSVSQSDATEPSQDDETKKSFTTSPSSSLSFSEQLLCADVATPKPILKKSNLQSSPSSDQDRIPPSYHDQKKFSSIINTKSYVKLTPVQTSTKIYIPFKPKANIPKPAPRPSLKQSSSDRQDESLV